MENALEVRGLTKHYRGFTLDGVSFSLPTGCIMGFIGENVFFGDESKCFFNVQANHIFLV